MAANMKSDVADLQKRFNVIGYEQLNQYCYRVAPPDPLAPSSPTPLTTPAGSLKGKLAATYASLFPKYPKNALAQAPPGEGEEARPPHPLLAELFDSLWYFDKKGKNVDMLEVLERVCLQLNGARVTFCKSGKDRTGMSVTLFQSRHLGTQYSLGTSERRVLRDANVMRAHGVRLSIAEKNIGRRVYSFNMLQVQFLPVMYRPPAHVCESLLKKDNS